MVRVAKGRNCRYSIILPACYSGYNITPPGVKTVTIKRVSLNLLRERRRQILPLLRGTTFPSSSGFRILQSPISPVLREIWDRLGFHFGWSMSSVPESSVRQTMFPFGLLRASLWTTFLRFRSHYLFGPLPIWSLLCSDHPPHPSSEKKRAPMVALLGDRGSSHGRANGGRFRFDRVDVSEASWFSHRVGEDGGKLILQL